ncbi:prepilin-type N-terminal cleavage/methylation domain-containing protein [Novosphingobium huizhouense]|uniref:prepilin-type N-terminal cleavage/methylation domain-containing protein n=1 Tax=Novosphingobium huizhouense TaxID=2866625 RepID=UPI001CD8D6E7|nr:prepilin-type N-terminal cleavage/methylation domain-containing protein [Novosphingobium huizhouense]
MRPYSSIGGKRHEHGFTLIEALVVLAIVALVAGLAYPSIERARDAIALRHARGQVAAAVSAARAAAQRRGEPSVLAATDRGAALVVNDDGRFPLGAEGRITVAMRPAQILFYPDGTVLAGQVRLDAPQGPTLYVIEGDNGIVRDARPGDA